MFANRKGWKSVVRIVFTRVIPQERSGYSEPAPKRIEVFPAEEEKPDSQTNDTETSEKKDATDPEDLHLRYQIIIICSPQLLSIPPVNEIMYKVCISRMWYVLHIFTPSLPWSVIATQVV